MIVQPRSSRVNSSRELVAFLLVNAPNCHLSLVRASVVQGDAVKLQHISDLLWVSDIYPKSFD